jgi:ribonucleotide reductase beta subunit family protein with ferritin-like domain
MNADLMVEHVKFTTDYVLGLLGYERLYGVKRTPFEFMELISLEGKTNFFEKKVSEYVKAGVGAGTGAAAADRVLTLDDDF